MTVGVVSGVVASASSQTEWSTPARRPGTRRSIVVHAVAGETLVHVIGGRVTAVSPDPVTHTWGWTPTQ